MMDANSQFYSKAQGLPSKTRVAPFLKTHKMKKTSTLVILFILFAGLLNAQSKKFIRHCPDTNRVKLIDEVKLKTILRESNAEVTYLVIFTNNCSGTPYALQRVKYLRDLFGEKLNLIVCGSVEEKKVRKMIGHLDKYSVPVKTAYLIDGSKYK